MANEIFVDTSGFYSLLVKNDPFHARAEKILSKAALDKQCFLTSDYVLDETSTLLLVKGHAHIIPSFFRKIFSSNALKIEYTDAERFSQVHKFFVKHLDQSWSFTDCLSFLLMKSHKISAVMSTDVHFLKAGFVPLLN
jgi:predicted nucleic acid-binding protein